MDTLLVGAPTVYGMAPQPRRRIVLAGVGLGAIPAGLLAGGVASGEPALLGVGGLVLLIMAPFLVYLTWSARRVRLELAPSGVTVAGVLGRHPVQLSWEEIERVHVGPAHSGLVVVRPLTSRAAAGQAEFAGMSYNGTPLYSPEVASWMAEQRWVSLDAFVGWLEAGNLRADLERLAPHLVESLDHDRIAADRARRETRRLLAWLLPLVGVIVAATMAWVFISPTLSPSQQAVADTVGWWLERLVAGVASVAMAAMGVGNLLACWARLRAGRVWYALLWLAMGTMQLLLAVVFLGRFAVSGD